MIQLSKLIRVVATLFVLIGTNLFGLIDFYDDRLFIFLNTYDLFLGVINILFFITLYKSKGFLNYLLNSPLRYILYFYIFTLLIFITMPLRGPISIIDAARVGRHYLILPLAFLISYDCLKNNKGSLYFKLFKIIAVVSSFQIILNAFSPELVNQIFSGLNRAEAGVKGEYQRNVLLSTTMIFPHIISIYYFYKIVADRFILSNLWFFIFFFMAASLQGFRSYVIALVVVLALIGLFFGSFKKKIMRWSVIGFLIIPMVILLDSQVLNNQILGKFYTAYDEINYGTGSYQGRFEDINIRQIPMLLEKPIFGWGFIYHRSEYGRQLNIPEENQRQFGLYSVDSGFVTILMQYGVIGVILILFWFFKMILSLFYQHYINPSVFITSIGVIIILLMTLLTHGAFFREFGLVPFAMIIGLISNRYSVKKLTND